MTRATWKNTSQCGGHVMKDTLSRRFFLEPTRPLHRRDEALRAVVGDGQPHIDVAPRLGSPYHTMRRLGRACRAPCRAGQGPPLS